MYVVINARRQHLYNVPPPSFSQTQGPSSSTPKPVRPYPPFPPFPRRPPPINLRPRDNMPRAKKFNGGNRKKKAANSKPRSNGDRFVKKEVEKLPADFPKLQPVAVAIQARLTRQCKALTGARPTVENFSCVICKEVKDDCQFETTTNHIYCADCLSKYNPATSWWDEGDDDDNLDNG